MWIRNKTKLMFNTDKILSLEIMHTGKKNNSVAIVTETIQQIAEFANEELAEKELYDIAVSLDKNKKLHIVNNQL